MHMHPNHLPRQKYTETRIKAYTGSGPSFSAQDAITSLYIYELHTKAEVRLQYCLLTFMFNFKFKY